MRPITLPYCFRHRRDLQLHSTKSVIIGTNLSKPHATIIIIIIYTIKIKGIEGEPEQVHTSEHGTADLILWVKHNGVRIVHQVNVLSMVHQLIEPSSEIGQYEFCFEKSLVLYATLVQLWISACT